MIPTSIDGTDITGATIDGTDVQEITVDGQTVFTSGPFTTSFETGTYNDQFTPSSEFSFSTNKAFDGSQSLYLDGTGQYQDYIIHKNQTFSPGQKLTVYVNSDGASFSGPFIHWGSSNSSTVQLSNYTGYYSWIRPGNDTVKLRDVENGSTTELFSENVTMPTNSWIEVIIEWQSNGEIIHTIDNTVLSNTANVGSGEGSFWGFAGYTGGNEYFDLVTIEDI